MFIGLFNAIKIMMSFHLKPIEHQEHINFSFFDNNKDNKVKTNDIFSRVSNYLAISLFFSLGMRALVFHY